MSVGFFVALLDLLKSWLSTFVRLLQYLGGITAVLDESTELLQLLAYYVAVDKGLNVDMPRNLAKSVTVE